MPPEPDADVNSPTLPLARLPPSRRAVISLALLIVAITVVLLAPGGEHPPRSDAVRYTDAGSGRPPAIASGARKLATSSAELRALLASASTARPGRPRALYARVEAAVGELTAQFGRDRDRLRDLGAKRALERLATITRRTRTALSALDGAIENRSDATSSRAALRALDRLSPEPADPSLASELPLKIADPRPGTPKLAATITPAYAQDVPQPSSLPSEPSEEDRSAAPEGAFSAAIRTRADELGNDPVQIYEWVRNEIRFEPYLGVRKGAAGTLFERSGNDTDHAALLVALLRAADVPARYVHGTARLPIDRAANWLGLDTGNGDAARVASDILAAAGVPARRVVFDGTPRYIDFEHVWVEAYVPTSAYRGVDEHMGAGGWVALDPSIKRNRFARPIDMSDVLGPLAAGLQDEIAAGVAVGTDYSATLAPPGRLRAGLERAAETAAAALSQRAGDELTLGDALGSQQIERTELGYLPASLPFRELAVDAEWRAVPSTLVATVRVEVAGAESSAVRAAGIDTAFVEPTISYTAHTWELFGRRLTLGYAPATPDDAAVIDAYHGLLSTPAYAAALVPVLRMDGRVVARGDELVSAAWFQALVMSFDEPGQPVTRVRNPVQAGSISSIVVDAGSVSPRRISADAGLLEDLGPGTTDENAMTDARAGTLLSSFGDLYFARNDSMNHMLAQVMGVRQQRQLSGAVTATALRTDYVVSFPVAMGFAGLSIDVDHDVQSVVATDGDEERVREYMTQSGVHSSYSEGRGFEGALGGRAASAAHVFQEAATQGISIRLLAAANVGEALGTIDAPQSVKAELRRAVARDRLVTVPSRPIRIGAFRGTAYVIDDLETGSAAHVLSTGTNGGALIDILFGEAEANVTAMFQNIGMLTEWVRESGKGMSIQGDELFAPSAPDGGYCDVFVDKEDAAPIAVALVLIAQQVYKMGPANPISKLFSKVLTELLPLYGVQAQAWTQLPQVTCLALLYDFLYTEARQIALSCIG